MKLFVSSVAAAIFLMAVVSKIQAQAEEGADDNAPMGRFFGYYGGNYRQQALKIREQRQQQWQAQQQQQNQKKPCGLGLLGKLLGGYGVAPPPPPPPPPPPSPEAEAEPVQETTTELPPETTTEAPLEDEEPVSEECDCPLKIKFVCAVNKMTYGNDCQLGCAGFEKLHDGACEEPDLDCDCPPDISYVCGVNKETYDNMCELKCDGTEKESDGPCEGYEPAPTKK